MSEYHEVNRLRLQFAKANGATAADELVARFGGTDEDGDVSLAAVPPDKLAALAEALSHGDTTKEQPRTVGGKRIPTLNEIATAAWKRFNSPPKREK